MVISRMESGVLTRNGLDFDNRFGIKTICPVPVTPWVTQDPHSFPLEIAGPMCMTEHPYFHLLIPARSFREFRRER